MHIIEEPDKKFDIQYKGSWYHLPLLGDLGLDALEQASVFSEGPDDINANNVRQLFEVVDPEFGKVCGQLGATQLMKMFHAWQVESGITVGESDASSGNSTGTGLPSNPTSSTEASDSATSATASPGTISPSSSTTCQADQPTHAQ